MVRLVEFKYVGSWIRRRRTEILVNWLVENEGVVTAKGYGCGTFCDIKGVFVCSLD